MKQILTNLVLLSLFFPIKAQIFAPEHQFTRADSLRGMLSEFRSSYDVTYYDLDVVVYPDSHFIQGSNTIYFQVVKDFEVMQVDLFENMNIRYIQFENQKVDFTREKNAVFIDLGKRLISEELSSIKIYYAGKPTVAARAPWDGGFVWTQDADSNQWVAVACEGTGASLWWPNKDHLSDEPDSMMIRVAAPPGLMDVSNGTLRNVKDMHDGWKRYDWFVSYPINNYNVTVNIGNYVNFTDWYVSGKDSLKLDYYVMPYNLEKAKEQFKQVKPMMACYEKYFGKYPFWNDGYKLVETPYLGMEHQSAIAYGNDYQTGYAGRDYSRIGLDFDYIIIHESGHEWWGNAVSCSDIADLWIHEGFCTYSEALYVECLYGRDTSLLYINAKKPHVENKQPIIGTYNVNSEGSGDMYHKGMLMLNTLRSVINNDSLWFDIIKGIVKKFKYRTTSTDEIVAFVNQKTGMDYSYFFNQYLKYPSIPVLEYQIKKKKKKRILSYRWKADVPGFHMPIKATTAPGKMEWIYPTAEWQQMEVPFKRKDQFEVAEDLFYVGVKNVK